MFLVRLACVRHAASVRSEPGSNSPVKLYNPFINVTRTSAIQFSKNNGKLYHATSRSCIVPLNLLPVKRKSSRLFPPPSMGEALYIYPCFFSVKHKMPRFALTVHLITNNTKAGLRKFLATNKQCKDAAGPNHSYIFSQFLSEWIGFAKAMIAATAHAPSQWQTLIDINPRVDWGPVPGSPLYCKHILYQHCNARLISRTGLFLRIIIYLHVWFAALCALPDPKTTYALADHQPKAQLKCCY